MEYGLIERDTSYYDDFVIRYFSDLNNGRQVWISNESQIARLRNGKPSGSTVGN